MNQNLLTEKILNTNKQNVKKFQVLKKYRLNLDGYGAFSTCDFAADKFSAFADLDLTNGVSEGI